MSNRKILRTWVGIALVVMPSAGFLNQLQTVMGAEAVTAKLQQAMAEEKYSEARRLADQMIHSNGQAERLAASMAYGRILLVQGRQKDARDYLATMQRFKGDEAVAALLRVYDAWLSALEGNQDSAAKTLQEIVDAKGQPLAAAEAADVLAQLYLKRGENDKAKQAVDAGLAVLGYVGVKGAYIETILRNRLKSKEPAGMLFESAEKLRQEKKYAEAVRAYAQVRTGFPKSSWSHPAGYRLGECLVEMQRYAQAFDYWKGFLKEQPAGPWRGHAHVAMVDLSLLRQFNMAQAAEHAKLAAAILDNAKDKTLEKSWQEATFEIRLRQGVIAMAMHDYDTAAAAFKLLKPLVAQTPQVQASVDRLIQASSEKKSLTPPELGDTADQPSVLVTAGDLYNLLGQYRQVLACDELLLSDAMHSSSKTHRSLAALGIARARRDLGERDKAIAAFRQSLSEQTVARWHEDTLRELALVLEQVGADKNQAAADKEKTAGKKKSSCGCEAVRSPSAREIAKRQAEAMPYWTDLTVNYAASRHVPEAIYHIGSLQGGIEEWQKALVNFDRLAREYPNSAWAGEAHLQLIDIQLERQFDIAGAASHATAAMQWFEQQDPKKAAAVKSEADSGPRPLSLAGYEIYVRAGLLEYLQDRYAQATVLFEKARPLAPPRSFDVVQGQIPTGIERLIEAAKSNKPITPEIVRQGDTTAKLMLMLADIYLKGQEYRQSWCLCDRLLNGAATGATREQRSWALLERGRSAFYLTSEDPEFASRICKGRTADGIKAALADFQSASLTAPQAEWASTALFLSANIQWNHFQDLRAATALWQRLAQRYPKSEEAARAAYYVAVAYQWNDRPQEARRAFEEFLQQRPDSHMAAAAREHLKEIESASKSESPTEGSEKTKT